MTVFDQSVTRIRPGLREVRGGGKPVEDWSPAVVTETEIERLSVQPNAQREEQADGANPRVTGMRVLSEPGTTPDILATDRIRYRGLVYQVDGEVAYWPSPLPNDDHIEFSMVRHEGG